MKITTSTDATITAAELARRKNVCLKTVHNWVARGILKPSIRIGRIIRFTEAEVEEQLREASK